VRYENLWREVLDPVAARLVVRDDRLELDMTVRPLIVRSEYRDLIDLTRGAELAPTDGDPHAGSVLHFALALGRESELYKEAANVFSSIVLKDLAHPLAWLGDDVSIVVEDDPELWAEMAAAEEPERFLERNMYRLPIALRVPSVDPMRLTVFLAGVRSFIEGSAPGLVRYETREHAGRSYVAMVPDGLTALADQPLAFYYASFADALLVTLREDVIHGEIERRAARAKGEAPEYDAPAWLGESAALRLGGKFPLVLGALFGREWRRDRQRGAWRALPILDEWRRLVPGRDPVAFHTQRWGVELRCPDGGEYRWDEEWGCTTTNLFGHPGAPRKEGPLLPPAVEALRGAELGVTFEEDGVRARVRLER